MPTISEDQVYDALRAVSDPEVGLNIVDLGLVYAVEIDADCVRVEMTMSSAACPMADLILEQAHDAVRGIPGNAHEVSVELVWEPPWTPDRMSDFAREALGW